MLLKSSFLRQNFVLSTEYDSEYSFCNQVAIYVTIYYDLDVAHVILDVIKIEFPETKLYGCV